MASEKNVHQQEREQKRRDWNAHITDWQASRLSQTEYCRRDSFGVELDHCVYVLDSTTIGLCLSQMIPIC